MQKRILSLLVDNTAGVLSRISGLFSRRGYNIDSLTVGVTADERFSRMTVVCSGDEMILEQITKQLAKLVDVRDIKVLEPEESVSRELVLVKVAARAEQRQGIISIADIFRAKVVDVSKDSLVVEMTGTKSKLEAFIDRFLRNSGTCENRCDRAFKRCKRCTFSLIRKYIYMMTL